MTTLTDVNLQRADLRGCKMHMTRLQRLDLREANLRDTQFSPLLAPDSVRLHETDDHIQDFPYTFQTLATALSIDESNLELAFAKLAKAKGEDLRDTRGHSHDWTLVGSSLESRFNEEAVNALRPFLNSVEEIREPSVEF